MSEWWADLYKGGKSKRLGLVGKRLTEDSGFVSIDSAYPTYLETIYVLSDVAQIKSELWMALYCYVLYTV